MKTNAGQLNLVTLTRAVSCNGLLVDEIPNAMAGECREKASGRIYKCLFKEILL